MPTDTTNASVSVPKPSHSLLTAEPSLDVTSDTNITSSAAATSKKANFKESLMPLTDPALFRVESLTVPSSTSQQPRSSNNDDSPTHSPYAPFHVSRTAPELSTAQPVERPSPYFVKHYHNRSSTVPPAPIGAPNAARASNTASTVPPPISATTTPMLTVSQPENESAEHPHQQAISSVATRHRSTSAHLSNYYNKIQNQIQQESEQPRSNHELWTSLGTFMGSIVKGGMDIQFALERLDNLECAKRIHLYLCQNVPNDLILFQNYIETSMRMEETVDQMNITSIVAKFLRSQLEQVDDAKLRKKHAQRDELWQCHMGILIRCTMMNSLDFQRFCSKQDIGRRQEIIEQLGFPLVWKVIRMRGLRAPHLMEKDHLLHAALLLLLRLTISTVNLESVREYSSNYYNVGQSGVDGAVQFSKYVETNEDKKRFWHIIDSLIACNHTRLMTLYILFNIALFRRSISSIIGNMSLFSTLCKIMLDNSKEPVQAARDVMRSIVGIETSREVFQHIAVGSPIYVISRGIASCNQDVYDKYFEKLVWNDVFLSRILEWGEVADSQCVSSIARVLYSIGFRTTLKSEAYRTKFSTLLIDNYEGFSNVTGIQSLSNLFVSQDTEVKIHSLLLLLSTVGYCEPKYHSIFLDFYHQNLLRTKQRQKELEFYQQEQNRVDDIIAKERLAYFTKLQQHSSEISNSLTQQLNEVQKQYDDARKKCKTLERRTLLWQAGLVIPFLLASWMSFSVLRD